MRFSVILLLLLVLSVGTSSTFGQQTTAKDKPADSKPADTKPAGEKPAVANGSVSDLSADEQQAIDSIRESNTLATVSFLASDEMAGRQTPSPELNIASAFVAAQFRGAGLSGGGDDETFYQTHKLDLYRPGQQGLVVKDAEGNSVSTLGVLFGTDQEVSSTEGVVDPESDSAPEKFAGGVVVDEVQLRQEMVSNVGFVTAMWSRRITPLIKRGATCVFVRTKAESPLPALMKQRLKDPSPAARRFRIDCPIVLLAPGESIGGVSKIVIPPRERVEIPVRNVIGVLNGSDPKLASEAIVFSAHLDHIGRASFGPDRVNNGADDNATGVTGVVSLAHAFSRLKTRPARSVIFMTFWGEEKGLLGSKHFADNPTWPLDGIVAQINLEMIGRPEPNAQGKAWMTGWSKSNLGTLMNQGSQRVGVEVFNHKQFGDMLYARSDNFPLARAGVVAHSFSAGSLHADYHQPTDEWEKLEIPHMTKVIRGIMAGALPIANNELTPKSN